MSKMQSPLLENKREKCMQKLASTLKRSSMPKMQTLRSITKNSTIPTFQKVILKSKMEKLFLKNVAVLHEKGKFTKWKENISEAPVQN